MANNDVLFSRFEKTSTDVKKALTTNNGGAKAEAAYADAYNGLVGAGERPRLRAKYRR